MAGPTSGLIIPHAGMKQSSFLTWFSGSIPMEQLSIMRLVLDIPKKSGSLARQLKRRRAQSMTAYQPAIGFDQATRLSEMRQGDETFRD